MRARIFALTAVLMFLASTSAAFAQLDNYRVIIRDGRPRLSGRVFNAGVIPDGCCVANRGTGWHLVVIDEKAHNAFLRAKPIYRRYGIVWILDVVPSYGTMYPWKYVYGATIEKGNDPNERTNLGCRPSGNNKSSDGKNNKR